jgi:peroxiredoxin
LDGFAKIKAELDGIDARVAAASADPQDKAQEVAAGLNFPVAFGVTRGVADRIGAWWDPNRNIIQPSEFIVGGDGRVLSSTYSSGPIGRVEPGDAIRLIKFLEARKAKGS